MRGLEENFGGGVWGEFLSEKIKRLVIWQIESWIDKKNVEKSHIDELLDELLTKPCRYDHQQQCIKALKGKMILIDKSLRVRCCNCPNFVNQLFPAAKEVKTW